MELSSCKRQKEDLEALSKSQIEKINRLSVSLADAEKEYVHLKQKTGEIIDLVMDNGQEALAERIYSLISTH